MSCFQRTGAAIGLPDNDESAALAQHIVEGRVSARVGWHRGDSRPAIAVFDFSVRLAKADCGALQIGGKKSARPAENRPHRASLHRTLAIH